MITDIKSQLLLLHNEGIPGNQTITLDVSNLSNGIYILHTQYGIRTTSHQLIINNVLVE